jgi:transcriptional regulator with PAS, ATPase and Fis domain
LRALQDQMIWPVGGRQATPVDVRVVSSTNRDLARSMREGTFRPDLYYRIAGYILRMPSLRERKDDIPLLAGQFMERFAREAGKHVRGISARALEALCEAPWPGNVRELENEVRRLVYVCPDGQPITSAMLSPAVNAAPAAPPPRTAEAAAPGLAGEVEEAERRAIAAALAEARGNRSRAAKILGISRNGLALKMKRLGMIDGTPPPGADSSNF